MALPRLMLACALAACLLPAGTANAARTVSVTNGRVTAQFADRGLVALAGPEAGPAVRFPQDDFAVTIGGMSIESRSLHVPSRVVVKNRVTYTWSAAPYRVVVAYEVASGWRFISKQISVEGGEKPYRVSEVVVFQSGVADSIVSHFVPRSGRANLGTGDYGACLRFGRTRGLLVAAQNPFLEFRRDAQTFSLRYKPDLDWNPADGPFVADRGLLALYTQTGRMLPDRMLAEWGMGPLEAGPGMDEAEVEAFTGMVRAFTLARPARPVNVFVPWCLNDYQIDIATVDGRAEYKRMFDSAAALGADYAIFAPANSDLAKREDSTDDWSWEHLLWAGFGQKIRKDEWNPKTGPVPASVQEMLDYASTKNARLLAYVYPVLAFSQNPTWLTARSTNPKRLYGNLGFRSLQDWLIETLVAFHDRLGLGGYSIDGVRGEAGTTRDLLVLPPQAASISAVQVNGQRLPFSRTVAGLVSIPVSFDGAPFSHYQQIGSYDPAFAGGRLTAAFTVPQRVFDQLAARRKAWPIPWTAEDYRTTWLAPERLMLFVQIAEPDASWEARLVIDGRAVELRKAYSAVRAAARTFVGFYADLSLLEADREHTLELELPRLRPGQLQGVFFDNIEPEYTDRLGVARASRPAESRSISPCPHIRSSPISNATRPSTSPNRSPRSSHVISPPLATAAGACPPR
jgi:hypothetical protein